MIESRIRWTLIVLLTSFLCIRVGMGIQILRGEQPSQQSDAKDEQIALLQAKLALYQRGLFACQDAQIEAQARAQVKPKETVK